MAAHILIAMDGLLEIRSGEQLLECRGIMIPSGVRHGIRTQGGALVFLFDSTTNVAARITTLQEIPDSVCKQIRQAYEQMQHSGDYDGFAALVKHSLDLEATGCPGFNTYGPWKLVGGMNKDHPSREEMEQAVQFFANLIK